MYTHVHQQRIKHAFGVYQTVHIWGIGVKCRLKQMVRQPPLRQGLGIPGIHTTQDRTMWKSCLVTIQLADITFDDEDDS